MTKDAAAEAIADELLYLTGKAIKERDDDMFLYCMSLPLMMETSSGKKLITTKQEVRDILAGVRDYMANHAYVDMVRTVISARFIDADTIESTHVSLMIGKDGTRNRAPYPAHTIIKRFGDTWKMVSTLYAILDSDEHNNVLCPSKEYKDANEQRL